MDWSVPQLLSKLAITFRIYVIYRDNRLRETQGGRVEIVDVFTLSDALIYAHDLSASARKQSVTEY